MKKVLFTCIGGSSAGTKPVSISLLSAILKSRGHKTLLFDTTFMDLGFMLDGEISDSVRQFRRVDWYKYGLVRDKSVNAKDELIKLIERERPDVIAANAMSDMYAYTIEFLRYAKARFNIPTIIGGVHATLLPEEVIAEDCIDALCIGEGEKAMVEFIDAVDKGRIGRTDIQNLWIKSGGKVHKNPIGPLADVNDLPFLDYSIYDERQFMRPFEGKILRSGDVQDTRGCPRVCPYCANSMLNKLYPATRIRFFSPERFVDEAEYLKKEYKLEFFKIFSEDILLRNEDDLARLSDLYRKRVNLPFTAAGHPVTLTEKKAKILKDMNCVSLSMALEEGNYEYRKNILKRNYSDAEYIKKVRILKDAGIRTVALAMMGLPYETEAMIFETISLLKKAKPSLANISMFFPYRGTPLGDICIKEGYVSAEKVKDSRSSLAESILAMPQVKAETLNGIRKMLNYYLKYPKIFYPAFNLYHKGNKFGEFMVDILDRVNNRSGK